MTFTSNLTTIGVLDDAHLLTYSYAEKQYKRLDDLFTVNVGDIDDMIDLAHEHKIDTLWIVPACSFSTCAKIMMNVETVHVTASTNRDKTPRFVLAWKTEGNTKSVKIAFPEHDKRWPFAGCTDAKTLLYTILYLQDALEYEIAWSPGRVGQDLMLSRLSNHKDWLTAPDLPDEICDEHNFAKDWRWHRQLTARECTDGMYLHLFDKNSMYLAACTSANLGEGTPSHLFAGEEGVETLFREHEVWNLRNPGVWKVDGTWMWTPEIEYLIQKKEGWTPHIPEAHIWSKYHQSLRWWGEHLWNARQALTGLRIGTPYNHREARQLAYKAVKAVATQGLGWLAMNKPDNKLYRPDWWSQIVATAHKNMGFKVEQLIKKEMFPCYVNVDSIGIVSEGEDIDRYSTVLLGRKGMLGGFKHVCSVPVTSALALAFKGKFRDAQNAVNEVQA